jgi:hypothetical protein
MKSFPGGRQSLALALAVGNFLTFSVVPVLAAANSILIGGSPVFTVNAGAAGMTANQRAEKIQKNIDNSLVASSNHGPTAVKITYVKGVPVITLGGYLVTSVDAATAKAAGTTPSILAQKWANSLKASLSNKTHVDAYIAQLTGASYTAGPTAATATAAAKPIATKPAPYKAAPKAVASSAPVSTAPAYAKMDATADAGSVTPYTPVNPGPSQLASTGGYNMQPDVMYNPTQFGTVRRGQQIYIPAGMTISAKLATSLSSGVAKAGDVIMAKTTDSIQLGNATIPAGAILTGQVTDASNGKYMGKSGKLGIKFNSLRTPDGAETPITAHITGGVSKYSGSTSDSGEILRGENTMSKVKKAAVATAIGAGAGAALGLAVGGIAGGGRGVSRGAWSGTAIGAGLGLAQSFLLRKGSEVNIMQGEDIKIQLDAPANLAMGGY